MLRELSIVKGWPDTVVTVRRWWAGNMRVLLTWCALSASLACTMLVLTFLIASTIFAPGDASDAPNVVTSAIDGPSIFARNLLVLALHALACFAGYVTHVSLPSAPTTGSRLLDGVQRRTGDVAMVFVPAATVFSIVTQSLVVGGRAADLGAAMGLPRWQVVISTLPHSFPELTAVFLPLAAWLLAARSGRWNELIAATIASVCVAVPVLLCAAYTEAMLWPRTIAMLRSAQPAMPSLAAREDRATRPVATPARIVER